MRIAHFAFNFRAGHKGRDRVDHDNVHCAAAHERVGNFQRLFARVGLGDEQVVHMYAQVFRIGGVERVFRVNKRSGAACLLAFGDGVQRDRRFARGLRAVDLDDAAAREPAYAKREVERQRAGGNVLHRPVRIGAQAHDRALAKLFFYLRKSRFQCLCFIIHVMTSSLNYSVRVSGGKIPPSSVYHYTRN